MITPDPTPLLNALGRTGFVPSTAREWAALASDACAIRDRGLAGTLGDAPPDPLVGSRLFGPMLEQSGLDPQHWAALAVLDLDAISLVLKGARGALHNLPPSGWLHLALPRGTAESGYGDVRVCWIKPDTTPTLLPDSGHGFGWVDEEKGKTGMSITWALTYQRKPASWVGFDEARTAIWRFSLQGEDDTLSDEEEDALTTAIEDHGVPAPTVSLGLEAHWVQESPATTNPAFRAYPPLLALHSSGPLMLGDAGTLGLHANLEGDDPEQWCSAWALDSH